jgi:hypothetical protein
LSILKWEEGHRQHHDKEIEIIPMPLIADEIFDWLHALAHDLEDDLNGEDDEDDVVQDVDCLDTPKARVSLCTNKNTSDDNTNKYGVLEVFCFDDRVGFVTSDDILFPWEVTTTWIDTLSARER